MVVIADIKIVFQWKTNAQVIYCADVSNNKVNEAKFYYGLKETLFKERYGDH